MNFNHIRLVVKREYLQRVRVPGFIIGTVLGVFGIVALAFLPTFLNLLDNQSATRVAVVDPRNIIFPYLPVQTSPTPTPAPSSQQNVPSISTGLNFSKADTEDQTVLSQRITDGKLDAYVVVNGDNADNATYTFHAKDRPGTTTSTQLTALLSGASIQAKLAALGISPAQAQTLFTPPQLRIEPIVGGTLKDEKTYFQSVALVYVLLILLYVTILMYGIQVAMGVVEEKSSRIMEILVTAVRPLDLLLGKVLGVGLAGLTQYGLWVVAGLVVLLFSGSGGSTGGTGLDVASVPAGTLFAFLIFFVLGYLLFAALYAGLGSLVSRSEDVNSVTGPLTIVMVGVYLVSIYALGNPDAEFVRWLSFIPFFTPMLMFIRVALSNPALWEVVLSIVLLAAGALFLTWIAAKIYRVGVLMYGKRPSFREVARLLRTT
ncbi:MAG: ABC transporter permease [Chloroflexota bacterium]